MIVNVTPLVVATAVGHTSAMPGQGEAVARGRFRARILAPEEIVRVREVGGVLAGFDDVELAEWQAHASIVAVEDTQAGLLVGYWPIWLAPHAEPLAIHPQYRTNPGVGKALVEGLVVALRTLEMKQVYALIHTNDAAVNQPMAERLGFTRAAGELFLWDLPST